MISLKNSHTHIIHKISAELTGVSRQSQFAMTEQLKTAICSALENLQETLDLNYSDSFYRADHLSVELRLQKADMPRLDRFLEEALNEKVEQSAIHKNPVEPDSGFGFKSIEKVPPEQRLQQLLEHFLHTGQFPWWAAKESMSGVDASAAQLSREDWLQILKPAGLKSSGMIERLAAQFSPSVLDQLIRLLASREQVSKHILLLIGEIERFIKSRGQAFGSSQQAATRLYRRAVSGLILEIPERDILIAMIREAPPAAGMPNAPAEWERWLRDTKSPQTDYLADLSAEAFSMPEYKGAKEVEDERPDKSPDDIPEYPAADAGMVLLHPFWERLFENLGLLEDGTFTDESLRERAVGLLHYLATGSEDFAEYALNMPKFLCGWPLNRPVNRFLPISDYEKDECASVLNSALSHWGALRNTSSEGLRTNFLQRNGVLRREAFGWSLYVEQKTQDILLQRLPWTLSVIKHAWMDEMLTIHW